MAAATIKMNDDGSFHLLVGATDLGTGSDTILGQIAAEVLGVGLDQIIVYSSDTDFTPFDTGAYASSTTYVTGKAVERAALEVTEQILRVGAAMLKADAAGLALGDGRVPSPDGRSVTLAEVCTRAFYGADQFQIGATASCVPEESPPPFLASFAEVAVDVETGHVRCSTTWPRWTAAPRSTPAWPRARWKGRWPTASATPSPRSTCSPPGARCATPTSRATRSPARSTCRPSG